MRLPAALAALLLATPGLAQDAARAERRHAPDPVWYIGGAILPPADGRVRIVTAPQGAAALTLPQYWDYARDYRRALARLSFTMPVARAEPQARREAMAATLARHPTLLVSAIPVAEIAAPDVPVRPLR